MHSKTLAAIFENQGSSPAIITTASSTEGHVELSFEQVAVATKSFIAQSRAILGSELLPGTTISYMLENDLPCVVAFLGVALMRGISAPLNPAMKQAEIEFYLEDAQSKVLLINKASAHKEHEGIKAAKKLNVDVWTILWDSEAKGIVLAPLDGENAIASKTPSSCEISFESVQPGDTALLLHTSGTTGRPKAVPLSHQNLVRSMHNISKTYNLTPSDRTFLVMPLFHVHGLIGAMLSSLYVGGSVVVPPRFSASKFWNEYIMSKSNWYSAVPTIHQILLLQPVPESLPVIRFIRSCSASLAPNILKNLEEKFKAPVLEAYAMTEASHQMCSNPLPPATHKPGSVGIPQGVELAILNDKGQRVELGEVCVRGENVTSGYLNNPEANRSSFTKIYSSDMAEEVDDTSSQNCGRLWFRTGDQGRVDADGYLFLTGRIKELINRGGEKISPLEVDAVLLQIPEVSEAVCFAVDDEMYGQEVNAAVVLKEGQVLTEADIQDYVSRYLAKFKVPKRVFITKHFPKTATGKIQRRVVSDYFTKGLQG